MSVKLLNYLGEVRKELKKVSWVEKNDTLKTLLVVIVVVFLCSLFFFSVDFLAYKIINLILNIGS